MKQPIWIMNSALVLLLICAVFLMYLLFVTPLERVEIEPEAVAVKKEPTLQINIDKIFENDLFGTYRPLIPIEPEEVAITIPEPPQPAVARPTPEPAPAFLDPLDITLRGILVMSSDSSKNRAIIQDNKSTEEGTYKVGDVIEGATLIRIYKQKILFLRPNGQQEVLYLREEDAKSDPAYNRIDGWDQVSQPVSEDTFLVSPTVFIDRVANLASFIDMLGLTTAYKQGKSVGCRIARAQAGSLGAALGLQQGDLIVTVDEIPVITAEQRLKAYNGVMGKAENDSVRVELTRSGQAMQFEYRLKDFSPEAQESKFAKLPTIQRIKEEEKLDILKQKEELAPTLKEIRKKERQNMMKHGNTPTFYSAP